MKKDKLTTKQDWREAFKDCYKEEICVGLKIILHPYDKKFPKGMVLRVETETEMFQRPTNIKRGKMGYDWLIWLGCFKKWLTRY